MATINRREAHKKRSDRLSNLSLISVYLLSIVPVNETQVMAHISGVTSQIEAIACDWDGGE
jgi:hypothetical protein